jgi:cytochrome d ubiquinol oxidase subunit I
MIRVALPIFTVLAVLQVFVFGATQATEVAARQPEKLGAMEGLYQTQDCAPMFLLGWSDQESRTTSGISVPCLLSILVAQDPKAEVTGLEAFPEDDWANVNLVFQVYHLMINLGMLFIAIGGLACILWIWKRRLWDQRWMLWILVWSIVLTQLATLSGWWTAEFGRQPWIVWQLLRTDGAQSPNVSTSQVAFSLGMFVVLYAVVLVVFLSLLNRKIKEGPPEPTEEGHTESLPDSFGEIFRRRSRVSAGGD